MNRSIRQSKTVYRLNVNGETKEAMGRPADLLLDTLRTGLGLTGAKKACKNGDCGACTVIVGGDAVHACLMLTAEAEGKPVRTIEGLADSPVQRAFVDHWAIQCGFCTPGFIVKGHSLLEHHPDADDETVEEWLQSNLCRCTGYAEIKDAIQAAKKGFAD
ncbi:(2Fe-2S)-binding protein [Bhargavaea ullalensis]|uniref:Aerobic-type carbon monoxide dehydrogenase small subunit (CoxS/CutS family) n=1 Tax=Bhargavaea ullalensis TaxID=1265685 RepID=A0ABV2G8B4_9BACL